MAFIQSGDSSVHILVVMKSHIVLDLRKRALVIRDVAVLLVDITLVTHILIIAIIRALCALYWPSPIVITVSMVFGRSGEDQIKLI